MSAFLVSKAHIDALVRAALSPRYPLRWYDCDTNALWEQSETAEAYFQEIQQHTHLADHETTSRVGRMLWLENLASIAARYPEDKSGDRPGPCDLTDDDIAAYTYSLQTPYREPVMILKALDCYEYQSCEHPGWKTSEAWHFCQALRHQMIGCLPGYDDADWEISA